MLARINGIDTHYEMAGTHGPWLTFSHSLGADISMWRPQIEHFARTFRVLAYDTRGHGKTSAPAGPYTLETLADDLHGLLAHLQIEKTHFVGLSMGGMIGQTFALRYPGVFTSMTLADTTSHYGAEARALWASRVTTASTEGMAPLVEGSLGRWFTAPFRAQSANAPLLSDVATMIGATPGTGYAGCAAAIARIDLTDRLGEIDIPVLVLCGADDMATPPAMSEAIAAGIPEARLVMILSAAHISNLEQPALFTRAVEQFLVDHA